MKYSAATQLHVISQNTISVFFLLPHQKKPFDASTMIQVKATYKDIYILV